MAKIFTVDHDYHTQPAFFELRDHVLINGQVYEKDTLVPIPFGELHLNSGNPEFMSGHVSWSMHNSTDYGRAPIGNIHFSRGSSDPEVANPNFIVDSNDSNIAYVFPPLNHWNLTNQPLHKVTLDPLAKIGSYQWDLDSAAGTAGGNFVGQNTDYVFYACASRRGSDYGYSRIGRIDKDALTRTDCALNARQANISYIAQNDTYWYVLIQSIYSTGYTRVYRVGKSTNVELSIADQVPDSTSYDGWYHPTQALELETDKESVYSAQVIVDAGLAFKWSRFEVDMTGDTAAVSVCSTDWTSVSGGQSAVVNKPTETGQGETNLDLFAIDNTATSGTNYVCMLPTEHDQLTVEAAETFRMYIFEIDGADKDNLIFKNYIDTDVRAWNVFQVQDDWKKIAVIHSAGMKFYNWNAGTETFDFVQDTAYSITSVVRDANDRIWIFTTTDELHMISATSPTRVDVVMDQSSYNYQGSEISTHADVSAYDIDNNRIVANVNMVLEGSIYYTDDSQNKTFATATSSGVQVDMKITGSSYSRVLASVVV